MFIKGFSEWVKILEAAELPTPAESGDNPDSYGKKIGITDKSSVDYKSNLSTLAMPKSGPIGSILKSAWANLNVPTRGISGTDNGNLGCAAAVSIIFYRATGLPIRKSKNKNIELGTGSLWEEFTKNNKAHWKMITDWRKGWKPGDIILTSRGTQAGHVGVVVEGGKVISNSSGGFQGDKKGQIELNYTISGWESIAKRNPQQTALFRYVGPYLNGWGSDAKIMSIGGETDDDAIAQDLELPEVVVTAKKGETASTESSPEPSVATVDTTSVQGIKPSDLVKSGGLIDVSKF